MRSFLFSLFHRSSYNLKKELLGLIEELQAAPAIAELQDAGSRNMIEAAKEDMIVHGEYDLALEYVCSVICEEEVPIKAKHLETMLSLATKMSLDLEQFGQIKTE